MKGKRRMSLLFAPRSFRVTEDTQSLLRCSCSAETWRDGVRQRAQTQGKHYSLWWHVVGHPTLTPLTLSVSLSRNIFWPDVRSKCGFLSAGREENESLTWAVRACVHKLQFLCWQLKPKPLTAKVHQILLCSITALDLIGFSSSQRVNSHWLRSFVLRMSLKNSSFAKCLSNNASICTEHWEIEQDRRLGT